MSQNKSYSFRWAGSLFLLLLLTVPTLGQTIKITIAPRWNPAFSLTSLNNNGGAFPSDDADGIWEPGTDDDDAMLMGVNIYATTNVEYWAADISCTVPPALAQFYQPDLTGTATDNPNDNFGPIVAGAPWGGEGSTYTRVFNPATDMNNATGTVKMALSRLGGNTGMGANGYETTMEIAYFQFFIKPQIATYSGTIAVTCTVALLDRSGRTIGVPLYLAPTPAIIRAGYSLSGNVKYQGATTHAGIGIACDDENPATPLLPNVRTAADGSWRIDGLRTDEWWGCTAYGNLITPEVLTVAPTQQTDVHTPQYSWARLRRANWTFLPFTLVSGNVERTTSPNEITIADDIARVTSNYNQTSTTPYGLGDANGDRKTDRSDLAIVTANLYMDVPRSDHVILSAQRTASSTLFGNRLWINSNPLINSSVTFRQLTTSATRDYWPSVSPDGTTLVITREVATTPNKQYALFTMPANGTGVATRITPVGWQYNAFAPSWSPDGSRIAFVCSWGNNYQFNTGNVCLVDVNGRNLIVTQGNSTVYPPTWLYQDAFFYGGSSNDSVCPNTLCQYDTIWSNATVLDNTLVSDINNVGFEDMPSFNSERLYYRYDDDGDYSNGGTELRVATFDFDQDMDEIEPYQVTPPPGGCCLIDYHVTVTNAINVDYYALHMNDSLLYVGSYSSGPGYYGSGWDWYHVYQTDFVTTLSYGTSGNFTWNNGFGNPWWNGNSNDASDLHALRITLNYLP